MNDITDLGAVSTETHGSAIVGQDDLATGQKIFQGGIEAED